MMGLFSGIKLLAFFVLFCFERLSKYIKIVPYWLLGCTCTHLGLCRRQYGFFSLSVTVSPWPLIFQSFFHQGCHHHLPILTHQIDAFYFFGDFRFHPHALANSGLIIFIACAHTFSERNGRLNHLHYLNLSSLWVWL